MIGAGQVFAPVSAVNLARYEIAITSFCIVQEGISMAVHEGFFIRGLLVLNGLLVVSNDSHP